MKNIITTLLSTGFTRTKKDISELIKYCYFIRRIAEYDEYTNTIRCNSNKFWNSENNDNRLQLIRDIHNSGKSINKMFHIYNRYENGDGYGIFRP